MNLVATAARSVVGVPGLGFVGIEKTAWQSEPSRTMLASLDPVWQVMPC